LCSGFFLAAASLKLCRFLILALLQGMGYVKDLKGLQQQLLFPGIHLRGKVNVIRQGVFAIAQVLFRA
jgi:hypothetical protein